MNGIPLTEQGKARAAIRVRKNASDIERYAAERLQFYIRKASGAKLDVAHQSSNGTTLHVGRSGETDKLIGSFNWDHLGEDGVLIRTFGQNIVIAGNTGRGTLYSVYEFLERALGCRWLAPGAVHVPSQSTVEVPRIQLAHAPTFIYREPYSHYLTDPEWATANRANGAVQKLERKHGGKWVYARDFVHNFFNLVPPDRYFAAHPEYYSEINGVRVHDGAQLCLSNPQVLEIATESCRSTLKENPDARIMTISQMDWNGYCTCARCRAIDEAEGSPSGSIVAFVNAVAARLEAEFPSVWFDTLAYTYSVHPPRTVRPRSNVIIRLCNMGACDSHTLERCERNHRFVELLQHWNSISHTIFIWDYFNNFHQYFQPYPNLDKIISDIPFYAANNVRGMMCQLDGWPSKGCGDMVELRGYLLAHLLWDHTRDGWSLVDEFCRLYYGPAADKIRAYLDHLQALPRKQSDCHFTLYNPLMHPMFTPEWIRRATDLFNEAEKKAGDDPILIDRVQAARLPIDYLAWKPSLRFVIRDNRIEAQDKTMDSLRSSFFERARKHGAGALREGGALLDEEERFRQAGQLEVISGPGLQARVSAATGGRIVSLLDGDGTDWFRLPAPLDLDSPVSGGYEEYSERRWRTPGWSEPYACKRDNNSLLLTATLSNQLTMERHYVAETRNGRSVLVLDTRLVNQSNRPREAVIRAHPVFDPGDWADTAIVIRNRDGSTRTIAPWLNTADNTGSQWFENDQLPAGEWSLARGKRRLTIEFDIAQVGKGLLDWNRSDRVLNLELFGLIRILQPGESLHLRQEWSFRE